MLRIRQYLRDHPPSRIAWRGCGMALIELVNYWMATLNYRMARYTADTDPADTDPSEIDGWVDRQHFPVRQGPAIYLFWHEYIPVPLHLRPRCRLAMLLSMHQDAELLSHAAHFAGLETVRGSSQRGGTAALRGMIHRGQGMNLAITPDGPRGPRRQLAPGCIYLSPRLQVPLVLIGIGYSRPWRYRRVWDQFAIPKPFSRARVISSPRFQIPPDLDRDAIEAHRSWIEGVLNQLTDTAERWAANEIQLKNSEPLFRTPSRKPKSRRA